MIMIIATIYIFLSYVLFDQQLKITFRKSSVPPPEKIHSPFFTHPPLKIQKVPVSLFLPTLKIFQAHPPPQGFPNGVNLWGGQFWQNDQKLHENYKIGSGGHKVAQANFLGVRGSPHSPLQKGQEGHCVIVDYILYIQY